MHYISTVNDRVYTINTGENKYQRSITIDATMHHIDWRQVAPLAAEVVGPRFIVGQTAEGGQYSLIIAGKSYQVFARRINKPEEKSGSTYEIHIAGQRFEVRVEDERVRALTGSITSAHE